MRKRNQPIDICVEINQDTADSTTPISRDNPDPKK